MGFPCLLDWLCSIKSVSLWVDIAKFTVSVEKQQVQWYCITEIIFQWFESQFQDMIAMFKIKNFLLTKYFPVFGCSYWM